MASIDQVTLNSIKELLQNINRNMGGHAIPMRGSSGRFASVNNNSDVDVNKLHNLLKNTSGITGQLNNELKKAIYGAKGLSDIFEVLEKSTRDMDSDAKKMAENFVKIASSSKNLIETVKQFQELEKSLKKVAESTANYSAEQNKAIQIGQEIEKIREEGIKTQNLEYLESIKKLSDELDNSKIKQKRYNIDLNKSKNNIVELNKQLKFLSDDELNGLFESLKKEKKGTEEYTNALKKLKDMTNGTSIAIDGSAQAITNHSHKASKAGQILVKGAKSFAKNLISAFPKILNDYATELRYNIRQSDYSGDITKGITEAQRAQLIGENRVGLRVLGKGNAEGAFSSKQFDQLQRSIGLQFGHIGKEALQDVFKYQNQAMNMGFNGSNTKGILEQATVMKNMASQLGISNEQMSSLTDSLTQNGYIADLSQKYAQKSDAERRKLILTQIGVMTKNNIELGRNSDALKQQAQAQINARFQGIGQYFQNIIQSKMLNEVYGANLSPKIIQALSRGGGYKGAMALLKNDKNAQSQLQKAMSRIGRSQTSAQENLNNPQAYELALMRGTIVSSTGGGLNLNADTIAAERAQARHRGYGRQNVAKLAGYDELRKASKDTANALNPLGKNALTAAQYLHGLRANPATNATGSTLKSMGGMFGALFGQRMVGKFGGKLFGSRVAAMAERKGLKGLLGKGIRFMTGIGETSGAAAGTTEAGAGAAGATEAGAGAAGGGALPLIAAVLAGLGTGYAITKIPTGGGKNLGDRIGTGEYNFAKYSGLNWAVKHGRHALGIKSVYDVDQTLMKHINKLQFLYKGKWTPMKELSANGHLKQAKNETILAGRKLENKYGYKNGAFANMKIEKITPNHKIISDNVNNQSYENDKKIDEQTKHLKNIADHTKKTSDELKKQTDNDKVKQEKEEKKYTADFYQNQIDETLAGLVE